MKPEALGGLAGLSTRPLPTTYYLLLTTYYLLLTTYYLLLPTTYYLLLTTYYLLLTSGWHVNRPALAVVLPMEVPPQVPS